MKQLDVVVADLAERQFGVFSRRQAYALGASRSACDRRVASGEWRHSAHPSVFVLPGAACGWHQRVMAAVLASRDGAVASHRSAAMLHGLQNGAPVELTGPPGTHRLRGVRVHQAVLADADRARVGGIPVTRAERTLVDLGAVMSDDAVEQAFEAALRTGLTTVDRVRAYVDGASRPGVARLRRVLDRRGEGRPTGSALEVRLVQLLRAAGLPDPVRQHEVRVGGATYFLDFAYPERRLAIELDGREHHSSREAFQHDRSRQNALVLAGWTVLRFTWDDVFERDDDVVAVVTMALAA